MLLTHSAVFAVGNQSKNFDTIYKIASDLTECTKPIVFARGNHDMRGIEAENFSQYVQNQICLQ